jgi:hypothetical protein
MMREKIPEQERGPGVWHGELRRTTVKLPAALDIRVRQEAARRGMTLSEWTREAIEAHLPGGSGPVRRLGAAAAGRSGQHDISDRIEEILAAELGAGE